MTKAAVVFPFIIFAEGGSMTRHSFVPKGRLNKIVPALTVLVLAAFPVSVARADYNIKTIGRCQTIFEPGSYALGRVITATPGDLIPTAPTLGGLNNSACIVIAADFVTLDLQGYAIIGFGPATEFQAVGIATDGNRTGVKVHSGTVTSFGYALFMRGVGHTVEQVRATNSVNGIAVFEEGVCCLPRVNGHRVVGNTATQNQITGIFVDCPAVVLENVASGNGAGMDIVAHPVACTRKHNSPFGGDSVVP